MTAGRKHTCFPCRRWQGNDYIPKVYIEFDPKIFGQVLHWDPALMEELRLRGARFPDYPRSLDRSLHMLEGSSREQIAEFDKKVRFFYFDHVEDPVRELALGQLLEERADAPR